VLLQLTTELYSIFVNIYSTLTFSYRLNDSDKLLATGKQQI